MGCKLNLADLTFFNSKSYPAFLASNLALGDGSDRWQRGTDVAAITFLLRAAAGRTEAGIVWRGWLGRPVLRDVEARQGYRDRPVLIVLIAGTLLAVAVLALLWLALA